MPRGRNELETTVLWAASTDNISCHKSFTDIELRFCEDVGGRET